MINIRMLKNIMRTRSMTQKQMAEAIDVTPRTFSDKLKKGVFGSDEIERMIDVLEITDPIEVFFTKEVTCEVTREGEDNES